MLWTEGLKEFLEGMGLKNGHRILSSWSGSGSGVGGCGCFTDGGFVDKNKRSLGWMTREKVTHEASMIKNQGFGFSWGTSLRRG